MLPGFHLPDVVFKTRVPDVGSSSPNPFRWEDRMTRQFFGDGRSILVGLPGAFTPTCSTRQIPGFDEKASEFQALGAQDIYCLSVNDAFVMNKWAERLALKHVKMIPDGSGVFTRQIGMLVSKNNLGFGMRSWRYAAVIRDCVVEALFQEAGKCDECGNDPYEVSTPENILAWLRNNKI